MISSFGFQLLNQNYEDLLNSSYELLIVQDENAPLGQQQLEELSAEGRQIIAYVSIAVTDDNQPYWDPAWTSDGTDTGTPIEGVAPDWLIGQPLASDFGRIADFTDPDWQALVIDRAVALVQQGYTGVYLDDVGRYFDLFVAAGGGGLEEASPFASAMMEFVAAIGAAIHAVNPDAYLVVNGDPYIVTNTIGGSASDASQAFLASIDAMLLDNLFGVAASDDYQIGTVPPAILQALEQIAPHAQLLAVEHSGSTDEFAAFVETAWANRIVPYTSPTPAYDTLAAYDTLRPPLISEPALIDFEGLPAGPYTGAHGLAISGLGIEASSLISGAQLGITDAGGDFTIAASGADFDFDAGAFRAVSGRTRIEIFAYDDGVLVGSTSFQVRSGDATLRSFDQSFDSVDQIVVSANGQILVDDLAFVVRVEADPFANRAPVAADDAFSTTEAAALAGNLLADNGSGADTDPDADALSVVSVNGDGDGVVTLGSGAILSFAADGSFIYDPNGAFDTLSSGESASDSFDYVIADGQGGTDTGRVTLTIHGEGEPPPPPPEPATVAIGFENGTIDQDGFVFTDTQITTRQIGVASGAAAGQSTGSSLSFTRSDAGSFDFEGGVFTAVKGKNVTLTVEGFLDGISVGTETYRIRGTAETSLSLGDAIFDEVDRVLISANGGVIVDDLILTF